MQKFPILFIVFIFPLLTACAPNLVPSDYSIRNASFPLVGEVVVAEVGDKLINQIYEERFQGIKVLEDTECCNFANACVLLNGGQIIPEYSDGTSVSYCDKIKVKTSFNTINEYSNYCLKFNSSGKLAGQALTTCNGLDYEKGKFSRISAKNFQRSLYYTGKSGNEVFFDYREFSGDLARPAFTQELRFDLSEGSVVGYKKARLEILKVSNTGITYKLLNNFPDIQASSSQ
jgi:hypothetical protein